MTEKGFRIMPIDVSALQQRIRELEEALHRISLASQNSMSSKGECGRIARAALATREHE